MSDWKAKTKEEVRYWLVWAPVLAALLWAFDSCYLSYEPPQPPPEPDPVKEEAYRNCLLEAPVYRSLEEGSQWSDDKLRSLQAETGLSFRELIALEDRGNVYNRMVCEDLYGSSYEDGAFPYALNGLDSLGLLFPFEGHVRDWREIRDSLDNLPQ